jgi:hypothetical protein
MFVLVGAVTAALCLSCVDQERTTGPRLGVPEPTVTTQAKWVPDLNLAPSGQPQVLMPGARSTGRWIEFGGTTWAPRVRIKVVFWVQAGQAVPAVPPDSIPTGLFGPANIVLDSITMGGPILRNVLSVEFLDGATQAQRQAIVDSVGGVVIGGVRTSATTGSYYVQVPGVVTLASLYQVVSRFRASSYVDDANVLLALRVPDDYLRPVDGQGWSGWSVLFGGGTIAPRALPRWLPGIVPPPAKRARNAGSTRVGVK